MLVVPVTGNLSWRNPPWLTLLLILVSTVVFFGFQGDDEEAYSRAVAYYVTSGLARTEVEAYQRDRGFYPPLPAGVPEADLEPADLLAFRAVQMQRDREFMARLAAGEVIRPGDPDHAAWRRSRAEFDALMDAPLSAAFGYRPAAGRHHTLFTYPFLHAGAGHLLGNMLFLWLFGCMLETGLGRPQSLCLYLLSGVAGALAHGALRPDDAAPLVGASAAIAGLMGALTTTYGRSRVTFFFSAGFYFNNLRLPAIALLPFWLGKEIFAELGAGGNGQVAFMAHAGGMAAGALLGWLAGRLHLLGDTGRFAEPPEDEIAPRIDEALKRMGGLDFDGARALLEEVLRREPSHTQALGYLFHLEKHRPGSAGFHSVAAAYLEGLLGESAPVGKVHEVYGDYLRLAAAPDLPIDLSSRLSMAFSDAGHVRTAGRILSALLRRSPDLQSLPQALLRLANASRRAGENRLADRCRRVLRHRFPRSTEARMVGGPAPRGGG